MEFTTAAVSSLLSDGDVKANTVANISRALDIDTIVDKLYITPRRTLTTFGEMWYQVFLWVLFPTLFFHVIAAIIAFLTLRKHAIGRFYSVFILLMGIITPVTVGSITCAVIAFVYRTSNFKMPPFHVLLWGFGQTFFGACYGLTRILATL